MNTRNHENALLIAREFSCELGALGKLSDAYLDLREKAKAVVSGTRWEPSVPEEVKSLREILGEE